jgi:YhcG PDDEXK nuclease domain/DUF1016 N-terminal domain
MPAGYADVSSIVKLLNAARQAAARNVNALMTASYWEIGRRNVEAEQKGKRRAEYGEQLIARLLPDQGSDFTFVGRQRRLRIDQTSYRVDLLLFHCRLRCLVITDLKLSRLTHADKGHALVRYAQDELPKKTMATKYKPVLPDAEV